MMNELSSSDIFELYRSLHVRSDDWSDGRIHVPVSQIGLHHKQSRLNVTTTKRLEEVYLCLEKLQIWLQINVKWTKLSAVLANASFECRVIRRFPGWCCQCQALCQPS